MLTPGQLIPMKQNVPMNSSLKLCAAVCAVGAFLSPVSAQMQVFGGADEDRRATTFVMFGKGVMAGASISYSAPEWRADYDAQFEELKGKNLRLGKNWWTDLDTSVGLEIAGTKIEPGSYFLGLHCDKDGAFHLLVLDAKQAMKNGAMPFAAEQWKADMKVPLTLAKGSLKESRSKMEIELTADSKDPTKGKFAIRWGTHELSAPVKIAVPAAAKEAGAKKAEQADK
jgi:hypothetical protein